jgi:spore coat polysaccharide biosynthesis predicted glycosyltransferase SpsG
MSTVVFVTDASPSVGGGHLARCLALAEAFVARGWYVRFAMPDAARAVLADGAAHEVFAVPPTLPDPKALAALVGYADLVVSDRYDMTADHERALQARVPTVAVADGPTRRFAVRALIDPTPLRDAAAYDTVAPGARRLVGAGFAPLRGAFARHRDAALARRRAGDPVRRIAVALGAGASAAGVGLVALARAVCPAATVDAVAGLSVEAVAALYARADLALGAAGVSALERCVVGLPTLTFALAGNQRDALDGLVRAGAVASPGPWDPGHDGAWRSALSELVGDAATRMAMAERAAALVDGQGAGRAVDALVNL